MKTITIPLNKILDRITVNNLVNELLSNEKFALSNPTAINGNLVLTLPDHITDSEFILLGMSIGLSLTVILQNKNS